jgi:hypothetical protein
MVRTLLIAAAALLAACALPGVEVAVTRFHAAPPQPVKTVAVVPASPADADSLAFAADASAVAAELNRIGFPPEAPERADLLATLAVSSRQRATAPSEPPVRIGVGVGGGSRSGVSGGVSVATGVGGQRDRSVTDTEMAVSIRRRADGLLLWEGRATAFGVALGDARNRAALHQALAAALFRDFPGRSGETRSVRVPL